MTSPPPTTICRRRALDDLVADLGSVDSVICVVQTFALSLDGRIETIIDSLDDGQVRGLGTVRDLRAASLTVGALGLADWCKRVLADPQRPIETLELLILAAQTQVWLESWLAEREDSE